MKREERELRELVRMRLDLQWAAFADRHPHLARAIERTALIEQVVDRLADDPDFTQAMEQAATDRRTLTAAGRAIEFIDVWVRRVLGL